jgi:hypothetical protein
MRSPRRWGILIAIAALLTCAAPASADTTKVITGHIASDRPDWLYLPVQIPAGTRQISVHYSYNKVSGNALDIGIFDSDGIGLGNNAGFRGWSGGARDSFTISAADATPGYRPGPIEPGTWNIILGPYQVAAAGIDYRVDVTLTSGPVGPHFVPHPPRSSVPGTGRGWYRGDLHLHSVHSDGQYTQDNLADGAKAAGLDYYVSTEHNTPTANSVLGLYQRPGLLAIPGEEVTTRGGHWGAIGIPPGAWIDWRYRPEDGVFPFFTGQVHHYGGLAVANHPFCPLKGCLWTFGYDDVDLIEVWNGPWTSYDDERTLQGWDADLRAGRYHPIVGASDAHRSPDKIGLPQTVVRARSLSRSRVLAGLSAGHSYVAESSAVSLRMRAKAGFRSVGIGRTLRIPRGRQAFLRLRVLGAPGTTATFHTQAGQTATATIGSANVKVRIPIPAGSQWIRAEVRRPDGTMVALTNPIFLR